MATAAENLAALSGSTTDGFLDDPLFAASEFVLGDASIRGVDDDDDKEPKKAKFGKEVALATAVLGSVLLGPVGGILLGYAQGALAKKEKQGLINRYSKTENVHDTSSKIYDDNIKALVFGASEEDRDQLFTMQAMKNSAVALSKSGIPQLQEQGGKLMAKAWEAIDAFAVTNKKQKIEAQVKSDELTRALGKEGKADYDKSISVFRAESASYIKVQLSTANLINALNRGRPVDQLAAVKLMEKTLDPQSVVRGSEAEAYGRLGSSLQQWDGFKNRLATGETLLPQQSREMRELALSIYDEVYKLQLAREIRFSDEITDKEIPIKYHNNFRIAERYKPPVPMKADGTPNFAVMTEKELRELRNGSEE